MLPVYQKMAREQGELLMMEGIRYGKELIYLVWIVFSLAMCSGIAVEHPVLEREGGMRYYLNVLGVGQSAYWVGNFTFDILLFAFQASVMVALVYPLNPKTPRFRKSILIISAATRRHSCFDPTWSLLSWFRATNAWCSEGSK